MGKFTFNPIKKIVINDKKKDTCGKHFSRVAKILSKSELARDILDFIFIIMFLAMSVLNGIWTARVFFVPIFEDVNAYGGFSKFHAAGMSWKLLLVMVVMILYMFIFQYCVNKIIAITLGITQESRRYINWINKAKCNEVEITKTINKTKRVKKVRTYVTTETGNEKPPDIKCDN